MYVSSKVMLRSEPTVVRTRTSQYFATLYTMLCLRTVRVADIRLSPDSVIFSSKTSYMLDLWQFFTLFGNSFVTSKAIRKTKIFRTMCILKKLASSAFDFDVIKNNSLFSVTHGDLPRTSIHLSLSCVVSKVSPRGRRLSPIGS